MSYIFIMYEINRSIAVIRPKKAFIDWANNLPDANFQVSDKDFRDDCLVILIPEYDTNEQAKEYISELYEEILERELFGWCTNEEWWPKNRTQEIFWQWFDMELHSVVVDPYEDEIKKERL